jgi:hypothetical protein
MEAISSLLRKTCTALQKIYGSSILGSSFMLLSEPESSVTVLRGTRSRKIQDEIEMHMQGFYPCPRNNPEIQTRAVTLRMLLFLLVQ